MKIVLKILFASIFIFMVWLATVASLDRNVFDAGGELWPYLWFKATLADTYFAFLTIYLWVFYKESCWISRIFWFFGIMILGNIAISAYMLIQLFRLKPGDPLERILLREVK